eukprot:CAMPEP_0171636916 /NCGR_PEP_ID=MMETSP0990-20121206/27776_1 /TAXON_ID=483369 /ORGANISM="non described non described, Strain CCMP2098" /LENGTH=74 /DNA_ID=CAMNT_0012209301 /DNA_START=639 /DNA_END=860 /DNA_ORIENTATION=-
MSRSCDGGGSGGGDGCGEGVFVVTVASAASSPHPSSETLLGVSCVCQTGLVNLVSGCMSNALEADAKMKKSSHR